MSDERLKTFLPWLLPLASVAPVFAVAFAPSVVIGLLAVVVFLALRYVGLPLSWRLIRIAITPAASQ